MLTTPIMRVVNTFDATTEVIFRFDVVGGNQVVGNNLVVERLSDNVEVYNEEIANFNLRHVLPADTLTNGENYRAKIRTQDLQENWSSFSSPILFWCYSPPNLLITTIDYLSQNRVYNQTVLFETTYTHPQNEILQSYKYILYNSEQIILSAFPEFYADGSTPLTQEVTGLENGLLYYLEVRTLSPNGNIGTTGLIPFRPFYLALRFVSPLVVQEQPDIGGVKLSVSIVQIILKLYDDQGEEIEAKDIEYVNNEKLDMNRPDYMVLTAYEGFNIYKSDFLMQIWCENLPNTPFLEIFAPNGRIELEARDDRIIARKYLNNYRGAVSVYTSNSLSFDSQTPLVLTLKQFGGRLDLLLQAA